MSAKVAGEGRPIVVIHVGAIAGEKPTVSLSRDIAKQQKAWRPTDKRKEGEEYKATKKPWLIHLQYLQLTMIEFLNVTRLPYPVAIFAGEKVWLWSIFPGGDTGGGIRKPISD